jgi:hypothetical protein
VSTPDRCPTCSTTVPEGALRCPACGRVFGEENRCPHCNAIAAVIRRGGGTVCAACGKPRAGAVALGRGGGGGVVASTKRPVSSSAMMARGRGRAQRGFGVVSLAAGILLAALAAIVLPGAFGIVAAILLGALGVGIGALSLRAGARSMGKAEDEDHRALEGRVLQLAQKNDGALTATQVAEALGLSVEDADRALTRMVGDGSRIEVDVDHEGVVRYVFREVRASLTPKVRVEEEAEPEEAELPEPAAKKKAKTARTE